jgi:hypothetical protein
MGIRGQLVLLSISVCGFCRSAQCFDIYLKLMVANFPMQLGRDRKPGVAGTGLGLPCKTTMPTDSASVSIVMSRWAIQKNVYDQ